MPDGSASNGGAGDATTALVLACAVVEVGCAALLDVVVLAAATLAVGRTGSCVMGEVTTWPGGRLRPAWGQRW